MLVCGTRGRTVEAVAEGQGFLLAGTVRTAMCMLTVAGGCADGRLWGCEIVVVVEVEDGFRCTLDEFFSCNASFPDVEPHVGVAHHCREGWALVVPRWMVVVLHNWCFAHNTVIGQAD